MAQPMPTLNDLFMELEDIEPLTNYWMVLKFIVVYPGCNMGTFEVKKCSRDGVVYLKDDSMEQIAQFSHKDNEIWGFLFDFTDEVFFKSFVDCQPMDINGRESYYWEMYRGGYLAIKTLNKNIVDKIEKPCSDGRYPFKPHRFEHFPW